MRVGEGWGWVRVKNIPPPPFTLDEPNHESTELGIMRRDAYMPSIYKCLCEFVLLFAFLFTYYYDI